MLKPIITSYKLTMYQLLILYKYLLQTLRILLTIKVVTDMLESVIKKMKNITLSLSLCLSLSLSLSLSLYFNNPLGYSGSPTPSTKVSTANKLLHRILYSSLCQNYTQNERAGSVDRTQRTELFYTLRVLYCAHI